MGIFIFKEALGYPPYVPKTWQESQIVWSTPKAIGGTLKPKPRRTLEDGPELIFRRSSTPYVKGPDEDPQGWGTDA